MITEFICEHKWDNKDIGEAIFKLQDWIDHLQGQMFDLQNQNCEYESRFKRMSLAANFRTSETRSCFFDGEPVELSHRPQTRVAKAVVDLRSGPML
jgi:hypothetical protein